MLEVTPWQIVIFGLAVAAILTAGIFIAKRRKPSDEDYTNAIDAVADDLAKDLNEDQK